MRTAERKMELQIIAPAISLETRWTMAIDRVAKLARSIMNRLAVNKLTEMTDQQLADIGLVRSDVTKALEIGLLDDPTLQLARAAKMRASSRFTRIRSR
ncbi:DUF1127 domain-containing protein [Agrobacterium cavarae]